MAKAPKPETSIDPEAEYRVVLKRSITLSPGVVARPRDALVLKGKAVEKHADSIEAFERV